MMMIEGTSTEILTEKAVIVAEQICRMLVIAHPDLTYGVSPWKFEKTADGRPKVRITQVKGWQTKKFYLAKVAQLPTAQYTGNTYEELLSTAHRTLSGEIDHDWLYRGTAEGYPLSIMFKPVLPTLDRLLALM